MLVGSLVVNVWRWSDWLLWWRGSTNDGGRLERGWPHRLRRNRGRWPMRAAGGAEIVLVVVQWLTGLRGDCAVVAKVPDSSRLW